MLLAANYVFSILACSCMGKTEKSNTETESNKSIRQNIIDFVSTTFATAIGVLLAVLCGLWVDKQKDIDAFNSMKTGLEVEARINKTILINLVLQNYINNNIQYTELQYKTSEALLSDKTFLSLAKPKLVQNIAAYVLILKRVNKFREADQFYKSDTLKYKSFNDRLDEPWMQSINQCDIEINLLLNSFNFKIAPGADKLPGIQEAITLRAGRRLQPFKPVNLQVKCNACL